MNDRVDWTIKLSLSSWFWWNLFYGEQNRRVLSLTLRTQYCWLKSRKWTSIQCHTASDSHLNSELRAIWLGQVNIVGYCMWERGSGRDYQGWEEILSLAPLLFVRRVNYWIQVGHFNVTVTRTTIGDQGADFLLRFVFYESMSNLCVSFTEYLSIYVCSVFFSSSFMFLTPLESR